MTTVDPSVPVVRLAGVGKSFGATAVLRDINLAFRPREIHALVGENGAGKSTVGKIVGGYYSADAGAIEIFGETVGKWSPRQALQAGIAMIHQELQLIPARSVAENVFLGIEQNTAGFLAGGEIERFRALDQRCGFGLNPDAIVGDLRIAERQKVEIMRAIARDARVIIMDEPTSSLTADEAQRLHVVIRRLKADGATIVYVTHFLDHVLAHADRVTILRDGAVVRTADTSQETKQSLVEAMLGEPAEIAFPLIPPSPKPDAAPLLAVEHLATNTGLDDISLVVRPGEIVGLIGLVGSGRTELVRAIFGADKVTGGSIQIDGEPYDGPNPARSVAHGLVLVPEDRRKQGLVMTQRVRQNMTLPHLAAGSRFGFVREKLERTRVAGLIRHFDVHPSAVDGAVVNYSGGNQQKVLLSKWVYRPPRVIMLDEPSRGVDIGARRRIHEFIVEAAAGGAAVLLISSEIEEVMALSHRGYLMSQGRIISEIVPAATTLADVLARLFQVSGLVAPGAASTGSTA
jgi:ABC-type sugar transport system ATPase subunit